MHLSTVKISRAALAHNLAQFRRLAPGALLAPVVKANAYGHGLVPTAKILEQEGADQLCVNALFEVAALRAAEVSLPIYVLGWVPPQQMDLAAQLDTSIVVFDAEAVRAASQAATTHGTTMGLHIKLETGNNRQGVALPEALELARLIDDLPGVTLQGLSSHYADIEDTTDHQFAKGQLTRFNEAYETLVQAGHRPRLRNFSNSAATILWSETQFEMVRVGISMYGMWPSKETCVSAVMLHREKPDLRPVLEWTTRIAQLKDVATGEYVGYGRSYRATHPTRLAILPVGYYDGYSRHLSNLAHVLVNGAIAPVRGRVCMNIIMVDVTDVPNAGVGDEVVLLGQSGECQVTAEEMAQWGSTINYEVTTRINDTVPRIVV